MQKIKAIGFDFGGVIGGDPQVGHEFTAQSAKLLGVTTDEWRRVYFSLNELLNTDKTKSKEEFWRLFLEEFNQVDKLAEVIAQDEAMSHRYMVVNQQVLSLIDGLRKKGYKVGLLSNATGEVAARIKGLGVAAHFDVFLFSIEIGLQKPDLAAFKHLAKSLGAELSELVFVDDATVSLEIAEAGGFTPILFKSYDQLVTDLTALKVL